jgi:hypothetical protein
MNEKNSLLKTNFVVTQVKRAYTAPVLMVFGAVSHLTQGGGASARSDAGMNLMYP